MIFHHVSQFFTIVHGKIAQQTPVSAPFSCDILDLGLWPPVQRSGGAAFLEG